MDYDNQKVRKLGKALRRQGVPLKIKTKNAETFGAETHFDIINIEYMEDGEETFDYPEQMFVSVETREDDHYTYTKDSIRTKIKSYVRRNFGNDVEVVDFLAFPEGSNIELGQEFEAETTCASCGEGIDEFDIIGDGTNRGLCCVPDYYDDEPEMVHCSFCSKIIGTEKEVYDEETIDYEVANGETIDYEVANGETICVSCGEEREKELKNDLDPHYSPFYAESESPTIKFEVGKFYYTGTDYYNQDAILKIVKRTPTRVYYTFIDLLADPIREIPTQNYLKIFTRKLGDETVEVIGKHSYKDDFSRASWEVDWNDIYEDLTDEELKQLTDEFGAETFESPDGYCLLKPLNLPMVIALVVMFPVIEAQGEWN